MNENTQIPYTPEAALKAYTQYWDELQKNIATGSEKDIEEFKAMFNGIICGENDLGDFLIGGDYEAFKKSVMRLSDKNRKKFLKILLEEDESIDWDVVEENDIEESDVYDEFERNLPFAKI